MRRNAKFCRYVFFVLALFSSFLWGSGRALAAPEHQGEDPVAQCAKGMELFYADKPVEALPLLQEGLDGRHNASFAAPNDLGVCALAAGVIYNSTGNFAGAVDALTIALDSFRQSQNRLYQAAALNALGLAHRFQGQYRQALESLEAALAIALETKDRPLESSVLQGLGNLYIAQGQPTPALRYLQQALEINREIGNRPGEGITLNDIGTVYFSQGRYSKALESYEAALKLVKGAANSRMDEATVLGNIGRAYYAQGRFAQALEYFRQELSIASALQNPFGQAGALDSIGHVYYSQGEYSQALESYQQALAIYVDGGSLPGQNTVLNNIGVSYLAQKQYDEAIGYFQQSLAITRAMQASAAEGTVLSNLGAAYEAQGEYTRALEYDQQALSLLREAGNRAGEGVILNNIGKVYASQGAYDQALPYLQQALALAQETGDLAGQSRAYNNLGYVYAAQGQDGQALEEYLSSIDLLETLRTQVGQDQSRADFISQFQYLYDGTIELLVKGQDVDRAFEMTERGRARAFLDSVSTGYVELNDAESTSLYKAEQEAYRIRAAAQQELAHAQSQDPPDQELIATLWSQLEQAEVEYQAALDAISARREHLNQLIPGRSKVLGAQDAQALLDDETTLLSFWILDSKTLVFILTKNSLTVKTLPAPREKLHAAIAAFRDFPNLAEPYPEASLSLYEMLIEPIETDLQTSRLMIVPHGELHYLPFAALSDGLEYLIDRFTIVYLPSVSAWPFIKENEVQSGGVPLILGDPDTGLPPLPFAEQEAASVAATLGASPLLGRQATESAVQSQAANIGILHLAAHGGYNASNPLFSTIYLAPDTQEDGLLEVHELYALDLAKSQLVVVSACDTQLGELSNGDELVGLTRALFFAGTPGVIASLWKVDDKATQTLMTKFYAHWKEGLSQAEALRKAQIETRLEYPHPYYWAAFLLNGEGTENQIRVVSEATQKPWPLPICGGGILLLSLAVLYPGRKRRRA